jgi:DNA-binding response OmpR family regulator
MKIFHIGLDETAQASLRGAGFIVTTDEGVETPDDLYEWLRDGEYDAVVINTGHRGWGPDGVHRLRSLGVNTPLLGIAIDGIQNAWADRRATFLESGGDEFLCNPPHRRELVASLRAIVRRGKGAASDEYELRCGEAVIKLDMTAQRVTVNDEVVYLTGQEMRLFSLLATNPGRVYSKEAILANLHSLDGSEPMTNVITKQISLVKIKFRTEHPDAEGCIETLWGRGYKAVAGDNRPKVKVA